MAPRMRLFKKAKEDESRTTTTNTEERMAHRSSQAQAVAAQVEASTHSHDDDYDDDENYESLTTTTPSSSSSSAAAQGRPPIPPQQQPVRQESALKRLGQSLRRFPRRRRSSSAPPSTTTSRRRRQQLRRERGPPLMEQHFRVEHRPYGNSRQAVVLPGIPRQEDNMARDWHDFFNLIALVPVVALNMMNWNWDILLYGTSSSTTNYHHNNHHHHKRHDNLLPNTANNNNHHLLSQAWEGDYFELFFTITALYFVVDLLWICLEPSCVRSPATIVQHHLATLLYILIPYRIPQVQWCMGACMLVEMNTWLLIARRVFNKQGFPPWTLLDKKHVGVSIRIKLISILFYITWIGIRCLLYPYLLMGPIWYEYMTYSQQVGSHWNLLAICLPLHSVFCLLNLKWTYDLLMSKLRYWRRRGLYSKHNSNKSSNNQHKNNGQNGHGGAVVDVDDDMKDKGL